MTPQYRNFKEARKKIAEINEHKNSYLVIWYTTANVDQIKRIIAIVVQNLGGQTRAFSIYDQISKQKEKFMETNVDYDKCEKNMLKEFYQYVKQHNENTTWLHWRMKLAEYGFSALENRYKVLGGNPVIISDINKIDVCELFKCRYGENFVNKDKKKDKSSWRIKYLADKNSIEIVGFIEYPEEEEAIKNKQYNKVLMSLSRKTNVIIQFLDLSYKNKLKTDSKWTEIHGSFIQGVYESVKDKWWFYLIGLVLATIISLYISKI